MTTLTPGDVRRLFTYADGVLHWARRTANKVQVGDVAGHRHDLTNAHIVTFGGRKYQRSHLVFAWHLGKWPKSRICHRNHDANDDHIENLVDHASPEFPSALRQRDGRLMGTRRVAGGVGWQATFASKHLGTFPSEAEAHAAYAQAHLARYAVRITQAAAESREGA